MTAPEPSPADPEPRSPPVNPGVRVRESGSLSAQTRVRGADDGGSVWTAPRLHRALLDAGLDEAVRDAIEALPINLTHSAFEEVGLTALDGLCSSLAADAAREGPSGDAADKLLRVLRGLGHGRVGDLPTTTEDVYTATPVLFAVVDGVVPHLEVVLDASWADRRRQYRADTLRLLLELGRGCRVDIVATPTARTTLWERHRDEFPSHVTEACNPRRGREAPDDALSRSTVQQLVATAREELDPDGPLAAICRALARVDHEPTYAELESALCLEDRSSAYARVAAKRLAELSLIERSPRPDGRTTLRLRPAGEAYVDTISVQSTLDVERSQQGAADPPKIPPTCRVLRAGTGGREEETAAAAPTADRTAGGAAAGDAAAADRPSGEGSAVANSANGEDTHEHGAVDVRYLPYPEQHAVTAAGEDGTVTLVDAALEERDDPRQALVGYDDVDDRLVVSVEFRNPLQWTASTARALTSWQMWRETDLADRLGQNFEGLNPGLNILQDGRNLGWLTMDDADGEAYKQRLVEAREDLLDLLTKHYHEEYDDRDELRSEITRHAHGLIGTMTHLLELAGVDVSLEVRVPEAKRHFGEGSPANRGTLCKAIATSATIQARYGHHVIRRHLYEPRDDKVERAIDPEVDPSDPLGTLPTAIVVAGDGAEDLLPSLRTKLEEPHPLREDAPEIAADIPIRTDGSVAATREAAERMLRTKGLEPTPAAVAMLHGLTRSPFAVTDALGALGDETATREIHLDEVRYALSHLDEDRLFRRDATPTQKAGLMTLLKADEPISQAELSRRAGFSTQSWRNNREVLIDADLIRETPAGWRLSLPFRHERHDSAGDVQDDDQEVSAVDRDDVVDDVDEQEDQDDSADRPDHGDPRPPWFVQERCDRPGMLAREHRRPLDVLLELVQERLPKDQLSRLGDPDDPVASWGRATQLTRSRGSSSRPSSRNSTSAWCGRSSSQRPDFGTATPRSSTGR